MTKFEKCWLNYSLVSEVSGWKDKLSCIFTNLDGKCIENAVKELRVAIPEIIGGNTPGMCICAPCVPSEGIVLKKYDKEDAEYYDDFCPGDEGYAIYYKTDKSLLVIAADTDRGILYGVFAFIRQLQKGITPDKMKIAESPKMPFRMIDHWDNMYGDIERGYSGNSFFYENYRIIIDDRTVFYARMMASIGINAIAINNVNVHQTETLLITDKYLYEVKRINDIFASYGIKLYLSVNYAAPVEMGDVDVSDPLDERVIKWWEKTSKHIYDVIPNFGGYLVKADSEGRPGPFTYGRTHADGANMLARQIAPYGGNVVWRCFVYNCRQDWRDHKTDRARAAYDNFIGLDGEFDDNVVLQIKNGPMDFQIREPVSPLFGGLKKTNMFLEVQIAQEYTGQQRHICYLVPMWKEILEFNTYASENGLVKDIVSGKAYGNTLCGLAAVTNTGNDANWTGHDMAAVNLYGYGRMCFDTELSAEEIGREWIRATFGNDIEINDAIYSMIGTSWHTYENYSSPLGIGWMVNPAGHYGPNVDGYEYDRWGTYHRSDCKGLGIDRSVATGTGYAGQYNEPWSSLYERPETTPEELLLFFHHMDYTYKLSSGKTIIQHIYDTHFKGVEEVETMINTWNSIKEKIDPNVFNRVADRLNIQLESAIDWRDRVNTYYLRMSGIADEKGRTIY
ncbi:MAG: alpha-glucuronidase [Lachnospiraceae bacterium]|nr:alpha-glucuronidase [Lachnospiraceae bacterium]